VALAPRCAVCAVMLDAPLDGPICAACWSAARAQVLPYLAILPERLHGVPSTDNPALDTGRAAAPYEGAIRDIIHAFKYEGRRSLAPPLGALLRAAGGELLQGADCVVPVPLHGWRRLRRGFNQAAELAAQLEVPLVHALWRRRRTPAQATLTADARRRNLRHAFAVVPWRAARMRGQRVVLVDDVTTTGATLHACAVALRAAGVREVRALTVAVTLKRAP
jgi:ComF family protein